jgi:hypothetical protein
VANPQVETKAWENFDGTAFALTTNVTLSPEIPLNHAVRGGLLVIGVTSTPATLTYWGGNGVTSAGYKTEVVATAQTPGQYAPLFDRNNSAVTQAITNGSPFGAYMLPNELLGFRSCKIVTDAGQATVILIRKGA